MKKTFLLLILILIPLQGVAMNRLASERSPYLRQHRDNPVNWYPWGEEALALAKEKNLPIFLSIGYASCHWCHVMEHESFENREVAAYLNEHFVAIKVDREERPDIDHLYMTAVQLMTGSGGWPLSVFLTPDLVPFYGGTYFPPEERWGKPGFMTLLTQIAETYERSPDRILAAAKEIRSRLESAMSIKEGALKPGPWKKAFTGRTKGLFDRTNGGLGSAPKFPTPPDLEVLALLAPETHDHLLFTLERISLGGIYDHVGGGFHRYSTTPDWRLPHYEKMLYDQVLLIPLYLWAYSETGEEHYARVVHETLKFMDRELYSKGEGYITALDADSEGEEGLYYTWSREEIRQILGEANGLWFIGRAHIDSEPSPIHLTEEPKDRERFAKALKRLYETRNFRIRPGEDTKVVTSLNGLAIRALALSGAVLKEKRYTERAMELAASLEKSVILKNSLLHTVPGTAAEVRDLLEDYGYLGWGYLTLFETTGESRWLDLSSDLVSRARKHFGELTLSRNSNLPVQPVDLTDGALPSATAVILSVASRVGEIQGDEKTTRWVRSRLEGLAGTIDRNPAASPGLVRLAVELSNPPDTLVIVGKTRESVQRAIPPVFSGDVRSYSVIPVWGKNRTRFAAAKGKEPLDGMATYYLCRGTICLPPQTSWEKLKKSIKPIS